jgi:hypothetical protein
MGLWLYEETQPWAFSLADELTTVKAVLISRGALDDAGLPPDCEVIDLRAVRLARKENAGNR